jgi:hypothetical protein
VQHCEGQTSAPRGHSSSRGAGTGASPFAWEGVSSRSCQILLKPFRTCTVHHPITAHLHAAPQAFQLPPLPFQANATEPSIDGRTNELHHDVRSHCSCCPAIMHSSSMPAWLVQQHGAWQHAGHTSTWAAQPKPHGNVRPADADSLFSCRSFHSSLSRVGRQPVAPLVLVLLTRMQTTCRLNKPSHAACAPVLQHWLQAAVL